MDEQNVLTKVSELEDWLRANPSVTIRANYLPRMYIVRLTDIENDIDVTESGLSLIVPLTKAITQYKRDLQNG